MDGCRVETLTSVFGGLNREKQDVTQHHTHRGSYLGMASKLKFLQQERYQMRVSFRRTATIFSALKSIQGLRSEA